MEQEERYSKHGIVIVNGPGGSPWVTDPKKPHLGGNFDGGDLGSMYPKDLWPWLIQTFVVHTMADVGAGTGETAKWFQEHGIKTLCVEGLEWNCKRCPPPVICHDLETGPCIFDPVDLIWCADTAEHIDEKYVDNLLKTLSQCRVLAMCQGTDAHPGGWHHVNNKPVQYWIDQLKRVNMVVDEEATKKSLELAPVGWWSVSGHIYRRMA